MAKDLEELIRLVYKGWKKRHLHAQEACPDEEAMASFLEGKLPPPEAARLKEHLLHCASCAELAGLSLSSAEVLSRELPLELVNFAKEKMGVADTPGLEIVLRLKEKMLEVISASGDILLGQEMVPAAVLRSRNINAFKDEVVVLKDFQDVRVQIRVENKDGRYFNLHVQAQNKQSKALLKDLRITLFQKGVELESYLNETGAVTFEHVRLGQYRIELTDLGENTASVLLDVRV